MTVFDEMTIFQSIGIFCVALVIMVLEVVYVLDAELGPVFLGYFSQRSPETFYVWPVIGGTLLIGVAAPIYALIGKLIKSPRVGLLMFAAAIVTIVFGAAQFGQSLMKRHREDESIPAYGR